MSRVRKLVWVEAKLFARDPLTLVFTLAFPLIMLFVLAEVFGNSTDDREGEVVWRGIGAIDFYVPAYVALVAAAIGLVSLPVHVASYREHGIFRRFHASGLPVRSLLAAEVAVAVGLSVIGAGLVLAASAAAYRNEEPQAPLRAAAAFLLVTVTYASIGILLGAVLPNARAAQGAGAVLFFVTMLLSGAGPPPEVLTGPLRAVADLLPLTHGVRIIQDPWLGFGFEWTSLLVVLGFLAGSAGLAARFFRWE
jgi:ABC-2 type transport system permease protein